MQEQVKQQFREDEVALIKYWDKKTEEWITNVYPKIGGRLRLAHEENQELNIETEIYKYDGNVAVVIATCRINRGCFKGIGMSSVERDQKIAPAILELAETRSISRALRFAGYGVEYCSAEEVSHLQSGNGSQPCNKQGNVEVGFKPVGSNVYKPKFNTNENNHSEQDSGNGGNGNGRRQLSSKQFNYIRSLSKQKGYDVRAMNEKCAEIFGVEVAGLSSFDASNFISHLQFCNNFYPKLYNNSSSLTISARKQQHPICNNFYPKFYNNSSSLTISARVASFCGHGWSDN